VPTIAQFDQDRYAATDEVRCITIYVPDDDSYMPLLAGLLALPSYLENYQDPESAQAEGVAAVWRDAYIQTDWEGCIVPEIAEHRADVFSRFSVVSAGTLTRTAAAFMAFGYVMQTDAANARQTTDLVYLSAGTWQYRGLYAKSTDAGITEVDLLPPTGGTINVIINLDQFGLFNAEFLATATLTIPADGLYTLRTANFTSKNPSSSGLRVNWTSHHFWRTGA
jgi:hypothetical protein